jgi:predicted  nucleic acid-binding Zn-ribbon protein
MTIARFTNFYRCGRCGEKWEDDWDSTCDDRCPKCNESTSPYKSEDIEEPYEVK